MDDDGAMDVDDMDIDLGTDDNVAVLEAEAMQFEPHVHRNQTFHASGNSFVDKFDSDIQQDKVHIRGLDNLTTDDIKYFASEHYAPELKKIEWIDDTSANIQYDSAELSEQALASFTELEESNPSEVEPGQLRKAKRLSTHPNANLSVRIAFTNDVKKPRARDASRFYLMNPDQDPRERQQRSDNRRRGAGRGGDGKYESRPEREEKEVPFDVNLYDDDPNSLAARINRPQLGKTRSRSRSRNASDKDGRTARLGQGRSSELLLGSNGDNSGRLARDRSASPLGEQDGRFGFAENELRSNSFRRRSLTPPRRAKASDNSGKELLGFGTVGHSGASQPHLNSVAVKELYPNRPSSTNDLSTKELFPNKISSTGHRRKAAMDAADGHGADLFANRLAEPRLDVLGGRPRSRNLEDRITGLNPEVNKNGNGNVGLNLASRINGGFKQLEGFNIRGTAGGEGSAGFSIRGVAGLDNPRVKELFPDRSEGNGGKELFEGKIRGRGVPRRKAEDMFS